ncbi:MAG: hypothetical protein H6867_07000 [Rhodospirillales bacterium]|nr:hypothetical protein [Rhodospirillales bacterium]MCB9995297.1 hypothetical protein [Rhodospirillales bacterium]
MVPEDDIAANDNGNWSLSLQTHTREALIDLSQALAHAFDPRFFIDDSNLPIIAVSGSGEGGKSMVIEAMMKAILDEYDPRDMKRPDSKREMFIESKPCDAIDRYCQAIGHVKGVPIMCGFDRITHIYGSKANDSLAKAFTDAANNNGVKPVGAIFVSGYRSGEMKRWLTFDVHSGDDWERSVELTVHSKELLSSGRFSLYWNLLKEYAQTGVMPPQALMSVYAFPADLFSRNITVDAGMKDAAQADELEMLKFLYWHHDAFGISKEQCAVIAVTMSDMGHDKTVDRFLSWLEPHDDDFASKITGERSRFKNLFNRYLCAGQYHLNVSGLISHWANIDKVFWLVDKPNLQELRRYFTRVIAESSAEKQDNMLSVFSAVFSDKDMNFVLNKRPQDKGAQSVVRTLISQGHGAALGWFYEALSEDAFPQTKQGIQRALAADGLRMRANAGYGAVSPAFV